MTARDRLRLAPFFTPNPTGDRQCAEAFLARDEAASNPNKEHESTTANGPADEPSITSFEFFLGGSKPSCTFPAKGATRTGTVAAAIRDALQDAGADGVEPGGELTVARTCDGPPPKAGAGRPKIDTARSTPPLAA